MSLPILQTKLYAPRHQRQNKVVPRPRLTERLSGGLAGRVTLISAPAGFGKSTLLSEWIHGFGLAMVGGHPASKIPSPQYCWLTLDDDDNDPVRFLIYLIAGLQKFDRTLGDTTTALLQSPQPPAPKPSSPFCSTI